MNGIKVNSPLKTHGGKGAFHGKLAEWFISLMPKHVHYVEPYAGGLSVLLAKDPEGVSEVVNDVDGGLTTFWRVMRCEVQFPRFARLCEATPFSEDAWQVAGATLKNDKEDEAMMAWAFFVWCRQSLAGRMKGFATLSRTRTRRSMNEQASAWLTAVEGLPAVHERLKRVVVLNRDALKVIRQQDYSGTFFYLDPPYVSTTRSAPDVYRHEMTKEQHDDLCDLLMGLKGKFLLSGYRCPLYDYWANAGGWKRLDFQLPNNAAGGVKKRKMVESVWMNYDREAQ